MERRTFFKKFIAGPFAAPLAAKAIPGFVTSKDNQVPDGFAMFQVAHKPPDPQFGPWLRTDKNGTAIEWAFYEDGAWRGLDQNPLRFEA